MSENEDQEALARAADLRRLAQAMGREIRERMAQARRKAQAESMVVVSERYRAALRASLP